MSTTAGTVSTDHKGFLEMVCDWALVSLVVVIFMWTYYAYVYVFCFLVVQSASERTLYIVLYHVFFIVTLWCFATTTFAIPPLVPVEYRLTPQERQQIEEAQDNETRNAYLEPMGKSRGLLTRGVLGGYAFCLECNVLKPDRCHHCSACRRCILKMDHHCPWFNNCVGFGTYKQFLLTLFFIVQTSIVAMATTGPYLQLAWNDINQHFFGTFQVTFIFILAAAVLISIGSFLWYHLMLVAVNCTTLESMRSPTFVTHGDSFDLGSTCRNYEQVFGENKALWLLPIHTSMGNGARFPTRKHPLPAISRK